jgi:hypothetical protein
MNTDDQALLQQYRAGVTDTPTPALDTYLLDMAAARAATLRARRRMIRHGLVAGAMAISAVFATSWHHPSPSSVAPPHAAAGRLEGISRTTLLNCSPRTHSPNAPGFREKAQ